MPELNPERLCEIEANFLAGQTIFDLVSDYGSGRTVEDALRNSLKQAREERDGFAAALQIARKTLTYAANVYAEAGWIGDEELVNAQIGQTDDPAECLKARDAAIRATVLKQVAEYVRAKAAEPKWSPSSDGELEHFAGHLADDIESDSMADIPGGRR